MVKRWLCALGWHDWDYVNNALGREHLRLCKHCKKAQKCDQELAVEYGIIKWEDS